MNLLYNQSKETGFEVIFMEHGFIDNKMAGKVYQDLKERIKTGSKISVISSYFTIYAYDHLKKELSKAEKLRFIFTEPTYMKKNNNEQRQYYINNNVEKNLNGNQYEIKLKNEMTQTYIAKECAKWIEEKVEIKSLKNPNPSQPRLIHINNKNSQDALYNGTIDFTTDGLGITPSDRMDMINCFYGEKDELKDYYNSFENLWHDEERLIDIKEDVLEHIQTLYKENSPEFIYFVTLYHIFYNYLDELNEEKIVKSRTGIKDSQIWNKLYKFQKDAVIGAIDKIEKYNGCIIADSVGLGKTFTALAIMKYYQLRNDRILVLAPKKLRENWTIYTLPDKRNIFEKDRFNYTVLNHTDLSRYHGKTGEIDLRTINWGNFDLVVIDESHNFRNNRAVKDRTTRYERLMQEIIKSGVKTKVLMLSATPVNNKMNDIKNQIAFITEGNDKALTEIGIKSINYVLKNAQATFNAWSKLEKEDKSTKTFLEMMDTDYFKLLDTMTIARSRKHIQKYYDLSEIGHFPERLPPKNIKSNLDLLDELNSIKEINNIIKRLSLGVYSPLSFVLPHKKEEYNRKYDISVKGGKSTFKQEDRDKQIVNLMRINMLKRLESSVHSFTKTVEKIYNKINDTLGKIEKHDISYETRFKINEIDVDDEELEDLLFGENVKVLLDDIDLIKWSQVLNRDKEKLEFILEKSKQIAPDRDEKLDRLKKLIEEKIDNPLNNNNKKVLIFTAFADTAKYLYENISEYFLNKYNINSALVTGSDENKTTLKSLKHKDINSILTNFSVISKERDKIYPEIKDEIDILIATDCISEGQNLQDCDYLINYDIHWNPVRIIQRFGRIDRIGSKNTRIQLTNFWPNMELDEYINLESRVKGRMVLLDTSATGEENLIEKTDKDAMNDLEYRKQQLLNLQEKVLDLEDISGNISITDLNFNDFKIELMEYLKENKEKLEKAPKGMYALTIPNSEEIEKEIKPGVIFTLKQTQQDEAQKEQNPLHPYFMVYITLEGEIFYNYVQIKKILDYYKAMCSGKNTIYKNVVENFNVETKDGSDMKKYSELLEKAIEAIKGKKEEKGINSLFSKGGTTFEKTSSSIFEDYELVSFLIIRGENDGNI
jgi:SNF2 family DNA or RNA helicase